MLSGHYISKYKGLTSNLLLQLFLLSLCSYKFLELLCSLKIPRNLFPQQHFTRTFPQLDYFSTIHSSYVYMFLFILGLTTSFTNLCTQVHIVLPLSLFSTIDYQPPKESSPKPPMHIYACHLSIETTLWKMHITCVLPSIIVEETPS